MPINKLLSYDGYANKSQTSGEYFTTCLCSTVKLAPTLLSAIASRLARSRPQSPAQMGQQPSKKGKRPARDRDSAVDTGFPDDPDDSAGTPVANGVGRHRPTLPNPSSLPRTLPSPYPAHPSPSASPRSSPNPSPVPPDTPTTPAILANAAPFAPGSASSAAPHAELIAPKDKLKPFDVDDMIQRLLDVGYTGKVSKSLCLKNTEITAICLAAREVFLSQPTLVELSPPVKIVGDVHGQYSDLIRLFEMCGFPPSANYLFLGDYVDRGKQSLETILLLLCYKIKYPENFFLLRGNHECANVTRGTLDCVSHYLFSHSHLHQYTAFMTNANDGVTSRLGRPLLMSSTVYLSSLSLRPRYSVSMAVFHPHYIPWKISNAYNAQQMCLTMVS